MEKRIMFEGSLEKTASGLFKNKTKIWMVIDGLTLMYYKENKRSSCIGSIDVTEIQSVRQTGEKAGKEFEINTKKHSYTFLAEEGELAGAWVNVIQQSMSNKPISRPESREYETIGSIERESTSSSTFFNDTNTETIDTTSDSKKSIFGVKLKSTRASSPKSVSSPTTPTFYLPTNPPFKGNENLSTPNTFVNKKEQVSTNLKLTPIETKSSRPMASPLYSSVIPSSARDALHKTNRAPPSFKPPPPPVVNVEDEVFEKFHPAEEDYTTIDEVALIKTIELNEQTRTKYVTKTDQIDNTIIDDTYDDGLSMKPSNGFAKDSIDSRKISNESKQNDDTALDVSQIRRPCSNKSDTEEVDTSQVQLRKSSRSHVTSVNDDDGSYCQISDLELRSSRGGRKTVSKSETIDAYNETDPKQNIGMVKDTYATSSKLNRSDSSFDNETEFSVSDAEIEALFDISGEKGTVKDSVPELYNSCSDAFVKLSQFFKNNNNEGFNINIYKVSSISCIDQLRCLLEKGADKSSIP